MLLKRPRHYLQLLNFSAKVLTIQLDPFLCRHSSGSPKVPTFDGEIPLKQIQFTYSLSSGPGEIFHKFTLNPCDQIGPFLKEFFYNSSPNISRLSGGPTLKNCTFKVKSALATFVATYGKLGLLFISTSGYTL